MYNFAGFTATLACSEIHFNFIVYNKQYNKVGIYFVGS